MSHWESKQAERLLQLAVMLYRGYPVNTKVIREKYGVSAATAKRDMRRLEFVIKEAA